MTTNEAKPIIIVTGSSGYIGSAVVKRLASKFRVIAFDRFTPPHPPAVAECVCCDITDQSSIDAALIRVRTAYGDHIASVIHLAAYFDLSGEPNSKYEEVTIAGTSRLLKSLQSFDVDQFVFASTMLVHTPMKDGEPIDESMSLDDSLPYRKSKIKTEQLIREERGPIKAVFMRPAGIYDDFGSSAFLTQQIARIYEKRASSKVYPGDLNSGQSYLHLQDMLDAVERIVERRDVLPEEWPVLLGEKHVMTFGALQKVIGRLIHNEDWRTLSVPASAAKAGLWAENEVFDESPFLKSWMVDISGDHYSLNLDNAEEKLGWKASHDIRTTLPLIVENLKRDPYSWYSKNNLNAARVADTKAVNAESKEENTPDHAEMMDEHKKSMEKMHFSNLWVHWLTFALGLWLATTPFVYGTFNQTEFSSGVIAITQDRGLWALELRSNLTAWNDLLTGMLIMVFATFSMSARGGWAQWANATMGIWLLGAPLLFWTPDAAVYANDTLIGALVIALTILIPMMPGMAPEGMMDKNDVPPGWSYSPSTYVQRIPIIALGAVGFVLSRILTAYQLGHVDMVWEPFFSSPNNLNGTEYIITSDISKAWPIADGGLGAMSYMFEILMGVMGGRARWRTMPWMVMLFGIVVVPLGVISIYFIIIQPVVIGTYCTICLMAAAAMLIMIPYSLDELVAMGQFLVWNKKRGRPFWRAFFRGDALPGGSRDPHPDFNASVLTIFSTAARGITLPWTLLASVTLGILLMFSRVFFETSVPLADSDHVTGALIVTVAVIAMAEVARPLRFLNFFFGLWLIAAPWVLSGGSFLSNSVDVAAGIILIGLSLPRGYRSEEHYGTWDRFII